MIKFFHKILIFILEKLTSNTDFKSIGLSDFVNIIRKKVISLNFSGPWLFTSFYFVFMLILPIFSLLNTASKNLFDNFWETATEPVALSAYTVTISMAFFACIFNAFFGFILAWVLVRYNFPGKRLLDAAVDLPFALPTSVAGLTLATVYSDQGWIGSFLSNFGIQIVFTKVRNTCSNDFCVFSFCCKNFTTSTTRNGD